MDVIDQAAIHPQDIADRLRAGQVGIVPTDTVCGLICAWGDAAARERIRALKGRDADKPLQILIADLGDLEALGVARSPALERLAERCWPGPLTLVLPAANGEWHGVRLPADDLCRKIIRALGLPLTATSANPAGVEPETSRLNGFRDLDGQPDFLVTGVPGGAVASTVARLSGDRLEILREGAIAAALLHETLGKD